MLLGLFYKHLCHTLIKIKSVILFLQIFKTPYSQTVGARNLTFWHNVHHPLCVMCCMSCVMCHVSRVTWHHDSQEEGSRYLIFWDNVHHPLCVTCDASCVMFHMSCVNCHVSQISGASWWGVCYQWSLPRIVWLVKLKHYFFFFFFFFLQKNMLIYLLTIFSSSVKAASHYHHSPWLDHPHTSRLTFTHSTEQMAL